jgi:hypothetical protein
VVLALYYSVDQIQDSEMAGACDMCAGEEKCIRDFGGETWRKGTHLEGIGLDWT